MSNKTFYFLAIVAFSIFAFEGYLFLDPQQIDIQNFLARVLTRDDSEVFEIDSLITDDALAHLEESFEDQVIITPLEEIQQVLTSEVLLAPVVVTQPPVVVEMVSPVITNTSPVKKLETSGISQDTQDYPRVIANKDFPTTQNGKPLQFIIFAFDGSSSLSSWQKTLSFAQEMRLLVNNFSYTYFINPVYLLTSENKSMYVSPYGKQGTSAIGFGGTKENVLTRIKFINQAIHEDHDIQSHAVGHWSRGSFSEKQWQHEFKSFSEILFGIPTLYPGNSIELNPDDLIGFRAPELAINEHLYRVLDEFNFRYDTSRVQSKSIWPKKESNGIWQFPLDIIKRGTTGRNVLAMDYNFYYIQTKAKSTVRRNTPEWDKLYQETFISYQNYFQSHYLGNRAPVYLANHFGLWNDGLYW